MDDEPTNPTTPDAAPTQPTPAPEPTAPTLTQPATETPVAAPAPAPAPFSELPPMGTMQIGTPAGATGDGKGLPETPTPPPAPVTPQPVPTTYGDNHAPAAKRNKTLLIVILSVVGLFLIGGIVFGIYILSGTKSITCEHNSTEGNISLKIEWTINFVAHHVENGKIYEQMTFPNKVPNLYVDQFRKALQSEYGSDYDSIKVYSDGDKSIIAEGEVSVNHLKQRGKSYDEVKKMFIDEGYTCKDN